MSVRIVNLKVNGVDQAFMAKPETTLLLALREQLGLMGAKRGCAQGACGSCTVLLDGAPVVSCLVPAATIDGAAVGDGGRAGRRPGAQRRPAGLPRRVRHPVRVLHARNDHVRGGAARPEPESDRRRGQRGDQRKRVPLHRLRADRQRHPRRRANGAAARSPARRPATLMARITRSTEILQGRAQVRTSPSSAPPVQRSDALGHVTGRTRVLRGPDLPGSGPRQDPPVGPPSRAHRQRRLLRGAAGSRRPAGHHATTTFRRTGTACCG